MTAQVVGAICHDAHTGRGRINMRIDILKALAEAKNQKAVPVLKTALGDSDGDIHFWAADALYKITGDGHGYHRAS